MSKKGQALDPQTFPRAREKDLSITDLGDETVAYDHLTQNASCLNAVTANVWKACNGKNTVSDLVGILRQAGFQDANEDIVELALDELVQAELLLELPQAAAETAHNKSRRDALRSIGKSAAMSIPVISTINIQPAIAAVSCLGLGDFCDGTIPCCTAQGLSCQGFQCLP